MVRRGSTCVALIALRPADLLEGRLLRGSSPTTFPKRGFSLKTEIWFLSSETVTTTCRAPCPKK
jgi:hypothetical protein